MAASNDHSPLGDWLTGRSDDLRRRRWRGVLWIAGAAPQAVRKALAWIAAGRWQSPLWIGPEPASSGHASPLPEGVPRLSASRARSQLGSEHDLVIFDAVSSAAGFDPDAFGAISGTLLAGGWLVLLTPGHWQRPTDAQWPPDADYQRLAHWPHPVETLSARYLQRLGARLRDDARLVAWPAEAGLPGPSPGMAGSPAAGVDDHSPADTCDDSDCLTRDQAEAVSRLTRMRRRRPVVLVADRGRGKSAALGIAAARRLMRGERRLWIAASSSIAVEAVFERLQRLLPGGEREAGRFEVRLDGRDCRVEWLAPEQVVPALAAFDIDTQSPPTLFVDEAAAIPAARLVDWLRRFPRIAFATTVHGYEGTGRGFEVRLRDALDRLTPEWRRLQLDTPIRWAAGDPLEALTRDLLCLDAEIVAAESVAAVARPMPVVYAWLDRAALARDDGLLRSIFGLLVQAHYRTSPSDLRHLLDGPDVHLLAAFVGDMVVGICVVQQEGGFDAELANAIYHGQRRPRGHLLAQSLATHGGYREAALANWWRIMRIAVHPLARREGTGSAMIERVATAARERAVDQLGVSFGAEPSLTRFWRRQGFRSLRIGLTREASSGEPAQMMALALTDESARLLDRMHDDFVRHLPDLLAAELRDIDAPVVAAWLHEGAAPALSADLHQRLAWFAAGGGELAPVRPWLREAWLGWWRQQPLAAVDRSLACEESGSQTPGDLTRSARVAVPALFQYRDEALLRQGRRERLVTARELAADLLAWHHDRRDADGTAPVPG
ncbi:GNAT family N-acetyltransferase [uncultured Salinicola sp.]|uniref:tRNA(Met) cytidine acetyltransferase TmcA n=1 Tax=uncultured Salinicola sp. TaxID=1193542 RepID=UPI002621CE29|nr:GNAT family N-acetyltransferase [uncultured Salinicola sp.]